MTIQKVKSIEPRVADVLKSARTVKNADDFTYERFKGYLIPLVGWYAEKEEVRNSGAYVTAINSLCNALKI